MIIISAQVKLHRYAVQLTIASGFCQSFLSLFRGFPAHANDNLNSARHCVFFILMSQGFAVPGESSREVWFARSQSAIIIIIVIIVDGCSYYYLALI